MGFKEDLAAAKAAVDSGDRVKTPPIPIVLNGTAYEVVFYRVSNLDWSAVTIKHPPREGVDMDARNGYDIAGVAREMSAKYGRLVDGGVELEIDAAEWVDLWATITPAAARTLEANVWFLHERDAELELERAKKASKPRAVSKRKSS